MPNLQAGGPPLFGCRKLLIQYIRNYRPHLRQFLQPQSEDATCCDDRDPLIMFCFRYNTKKYVVLYFFCYGDTSVEYKLKDTCSVKI